jgi:hypothetical protein
MTYRDMSVLILDYPKMKNTFFILFLSITVFTKAQLLNSFGIKSGMSVANQTWTYKSLGFSMDKENRRGFYGVVTMDFLKSKYFNFTLDIGYCEKGGKDKIMMVSPYNPEATEGYRIFDTKFSYLSFSPLFKVKYETKHVVPYVLLGWRMDYMAFYRSDFNMVALEDDFRKTIFGATAGAGIEFKTKHFGIHPEFQYQYDLTKLLDLPVSPTSAGLSVKNKALIFSLGIKYYLNASKESGSK